MPAKDCPHTWDPCGNEYRCAKRSIQFTGADERSYELRKRDRAFALDSAAYRRLRAEGLQPRGVDKSSTLEVVADHKAEVMLGRSLSTREKNALNRDAKGLL